MHYAKCNEVLAGDILTLKFSTIRLEIFLATYNVFQDLRVVKNGQTKIMQFGLYEGKIIQLRKLVNQSFCVIILITHLFMDDDLALRNREGR